MIILIEWLATILSVIGVIFIARKNIIGFYIWIVSNFLWIYFGIVKESYGIITLFTIYLGTSIYGIYKWKKK